MAELGYALLGGALIGLGSACLLLFNGQVAGISGILDALLSGNAGDRFWRPAFIAGISIPALIVGVGQIEQEHSLPILLASGFLVGVGTRLGSGCTSGHGVCGLANGSLRSLVATLTFMAAAILTVYVTRHFLAS